MIALVLAAAAATASSVVTDIANAERAFARRAQSEGQWAAFRATAAPEAIMFVPDVKPLATALTGAVEPAVPVMWWPATIAHSCDGTLGFSTGPWVRAASAGTGTFSTIWKRSGAGYRWVLDHGRSTPKLIPAGNAPAVIAPACEGATQSGAASREAEYGKIASAVAARAGIDGAAAFAHYATSDVLVQNENALPARGVSALPPTKFGPALASGRSDDWTLAWASRALIGGQPGAHDLRVWQWRGREGWKLVVYETVGLK